MIITYEHGDKFFVKGSRELVYLLLDKNNENLWRCHRYGLYRESVTSFTQNPISGNEYYVKYI